MAQGVQNLHEFYREVFEYFKLNSDPMDSFLDFRDRIYDVAFSVNHHLTDNLDPNALEQITINFVDGYIEEFLYFLIGIRLLILPEGRFFDDEEVFKNISDPNGKMNTIILQAMFWFYSVTKNREEIQLCKLSHL
jgi:hypothetical protein